MKLRTNRAGFTLVEMLVATALIMFIMLILSEAFVAGLNAFRTLKGIGDMESRIKSAVTPLRDDLRQDHFDGRRRLSDPLFWNQGTPREGFVNVTQGFYPVYSINAITPGLQTVTPLNSSGQNATQWSLSQNTIQWYTWTLLPRTTLANGVTIPGTILLVDATGTPEYVEVLAVTPTTFTANFTANHPNAPITIRVIRQPEGVDADSLLVTRATDHILHLAVKLRGNRQENFFTAHLPWNSPFFPVLLNPGPPPPTVPNPNYTPTTFFDQATDGRFQDQVSSPPITGYKTQWAEIAYFLWPNGTSANGTPLFALYRAEFKVVPDNRYVNGWVYNPPVPPPIASVNGWNPVTGDGYQEMSARSGSTTIGGVTYNTYYFPSPSSLANMRTTALGDSQPDRTFTYFYRAEGRGPFDPSAAEIWSATLIATDVVSFDVQILSPQSGVADFTDIPGGVFDTAMQQPYTINAIKITLRVWDLKTRQTRQVSIIQDM